jgi:AAHS family 4-hydroxybenzoate transporter-like MFS transporter
VGTVVPLLLVPVVAVTLRRTARAEAPAEDRAPGESRSLVLSLFRGSLATSTTLLWAFAFLIFTTYYAFNSWLPTLLLENGFSRTAAPIAGAALGIGGILGGLLLVAFSTRVRVATILVGSTVVALAFMFLIGTGVVAGRQVLPVFGGVALGLVAGMAGQAALAVSLYPERARTTGVGWAAALGRLGSIAGPAIGGALLASGTSARSIVVFACLPVALAAVVVATLDRRLTPSHAGPRPAFTETQ